MWRLIGVINKGPDQYSLWERDETDGLRTYSVTKAGDSQSVKDGGYYRLSAVLQLKGL